MKVNATVFIVYFLLQWLFLNVKMNLLKNKFEVLYAKS